MLYRYLYDAYRCSESAAVLVPTLEIIGPERRKLNRDRLAKILEGFRDGDSIPSVEVFYESEVNPPGGRRITCTSFIEG